jgi:hypothetical protein
VLQDAAPTRAPAAPAAPASAPVVVAAAPTAPPAAAKPPPAVTPPVTPAPASAPVKPAPASAATAPPASAAKPTPPAVAASVPAKVVPPAAVDPKQRDVAIDEAGLRKAVQAWAQAWSRKDADGYVAAYAPGFKGSEATAAAWKAARRLRILNKKQISVVVSDMALVFGKGRGSASFTQAYTADQLQLVSRKTLDFELRDGHWLIVRESAAAGR